MRYGEVHDLGDGHTSVQISDSRLQRIDTKTSTFTNCTILVLLREELPMFASYYLYLLGVRM